MRPSYCTALADRGEDFGLRFASRFLGSSHPIFLAHRAHGALPSGAHGTGSSEARCCRHRMGEISSIEGESNRLAKRGMRVPRKTTTRNRSHLHVVKERSAPLQDTSLLRIQPPTSTSWALALSTQRNRLVGRFSQEGTHAVPASLAPSCNLMGHIRRDCGLLNWTLLQWSRDLYNSRTRVLRCVFMSHAGYFRTRHCTVVGVAGKGRLATATPGCTPLHKPYRPGTRVHWESP